MSLFEFVTVMVSIILALCVGHILRSASFLAKTNQQVKYYLPYTLWSVMVLLSVINHWWSLWDLRDLDWSYASFLYILAAPLVITFATGLLSPNHSSSTPIDLELHYARVRRLFFSVLTAYLFLMWFDGPLFTEQRVLGAVGLITAPIIAASVVCFLSGDRRLNALGGSVSIAILLVVMALRYAAG